jgi:hypothetical protein
MLKLFAFALALVASLGFSAGDAEAHGHGCYGASYGGCARAYVARPCAVAYRPCKRMKLGRIFRKAPPCAAYAPCAAPAYVVRDAPVVIDVQPVRRAFYPRPCGVYRGCGHW